MATKQQGIRLKGAERKGGCEHHLPLTHLSHFYPFLTSLQSLTVWQMGQGRSETWTVPGRHSRVEAHRAGHAALDRWPKAHLARPGTPGAPHLCSMHVSVLRKTLQHVTVLWYAGAWSTISTYSRWVAEWPMFVGDLSLKAECGSHTPWHALARPGTPWHMQVSKLVVSQGFMQDMDWIWCLQFLACRIVMPWSHPRRNESDDRRRGRRRRPSCLHRRWEDHGYLMQNVAASSGTAVWTTHPNQSNIATAEIGRPNNIELNYQLICKVFQCVVAECCRSVGYFLGH